MKTTGILDFAKKTGKTVDLRLILARTFKGPGFIPSNFRSSLFALDHS
ncbi:MAG: hypothetical protein AABZ57_08060 [Candidatus Margulisiibacteriota bacterium]